MSAETVTIRVNRLRLRWLLLCVYMCSSRLTIYDGGGAREGKRFIVLREPGTRLLSFHVKHAIRELRSYILGQGSPSIASRSSRRFVAKLIMFGVFEERVWCFCGALSVITWHLIGLNISYAGCIIARMYASNDIRGFCCF